MSCIPLETLAAVTAAAGRLVLDVYRGEFCVEFRVIRFLAREEGRRVEDTRGSGP